MQSVAPAGELPFSKRLQQQLELGMVPSRYQDSLQRYISGHLFEMIRRNLLNNNLVNTQRLLKDPRTRADLKRWSYWRLKLALKTLSFQRPQSIH